MKNIKTHIDENILTIQIDLNKEYGPSKSGKTIIVGSTYGTTSIDNQSNVKINITAFKKPGVSIPSQFDFDETPKRKEVNNVTPKQISRNGINKKTKEEISLDFRRRGRTNIFLKTPDSWRE